MCVCVEVLRVCELFELPEKQTANAASRNYDDDGACDKCPYI